MSQRPFPISKFTITVVQLLDTIQHNDTNYTHEQRVRNLNFAYTEAANHFAQPHVQQTLKVKTERLQAALQTITGMVVYCWVNASPELMAALTIHYTYTLVLDDSEDDPYPVMQNFFGDMMNGKPQKHPWWELVNDHFPNLLKHYGPFCSLNIYRSTVDCEWSWTLTNFLQVVKLLKHLQCLSSRAAGLSNTPSTAIEVARTTLTSSGA